MRFKLATNFKICFCCGVKIELTGLAWACRACWNGGVVPVEVRDVLHKMPSHIPIDQHYRYIRRLYLGKVGYDTIK